MTVHNFNTQYNKHTAVQFTVQPLSRAAAARAKEYQWSLCITGYTRCFNKKHPLLFYSISSREMIRSAQKLH